MIKINSKRWSISKLGKLYFVLLPFLILIPNVSSNKVPEKLVQEGEIVHIPCKVLSELNSIQWFKDGKPVLLDFSHSQRRHWNLSVEGVAYVSIKSASMQDAGEWECWHYNNNSPIAKIKVMNLIVSKPPTPPVLLLNGKSISSTDNLPEYALNIVEKSLSSSNKDNSKNNSNNAVISTSSSRLTLREKYLLTVDCVQLAWTAPKQPSHWFVAGVNMTENAQLFMEYLTDQQVYKVRSSLTFNVTKEMHRGHLVCESENSNWPNSQSMATIELDVQYEPSFSISRTPEFGYHVIPGMTLTLTCDLDANPPAQAKWIRDGDKNAANQSLASDNIMDTSALNNAQLIFKEITDANAGWYKCIADHAFGHFESYGYYLAVRSDGNSAQSNTRHTSISNFGNQSQDQELNRQKQRNTPVKNNNLYNYYHDQQPITNNLNKSLNQKNSQFLTNDINAAQLNSNHVGSNVANYINSSNVQNKNKCDTPGKPMVVALNRTVFAEVGQQVVVYAVFCCEPKPRKVLWIHRHFSFKPATTFSSYTASKLFMASNSRNCYRSTFKIDNVKKEDSGELFFLVSNLKGLDDAFIHLTVTGKASRKY